jgi:hypothetical protein
MPLINAFVLKILFQAQLLSYVLDMDFMPPKACAPALLKSKALND